MKRFHDVEIYAGTEVATSGSRLELGAKNLFLRKIFSEMNCCDGCQEPVVIIFPDEDKNTLREAFDQLAHFKTGLSIIQNPEKVNSLLSRLRLLSPEPATTTRDRCSRIQSDCDPSEVGHSQSNRLSASLEWIIKQEEVLHGSEDHPGRVNNDGLAEVVDTEMREFISSEPSLDLVITRVETVLEPGIDEHEEIRRREVKVDVENLDVTQLRISPEVPPASVHERVTLVKRAASDSVYKILNKRKTCEKSKPRYRCKIEDCQMVRKGRDRLYRHYCYAHFKEDLLGLIGGRQENCPYCGLKFQKSTDAIGHVGCVHNKLEDFLPKRLHIKSSIVKKSSKPKSKVASSSDKARASFSDFSCGLCEKKEFGSRNHLYEHYSQVHYRAELRPFINKESAECSRCNYIHKNTTEYNKIRHMGVVHGLLEEENILPSHLRIPKLCYPVTGGKKSVEKAVPRDKNVTKKSLKERYPESNRKVKKCHLCPYQNVNRNKLYAHYSIAHFKEDLTQHIDRNTMECSYCGMKKNKMHKG